LEFPAVIDLGIKGKFGVGIKADQHEEHDVRAGFEMNYDL
jgi:hypothetical protein